MVWQHNSKYFSYMQNCDSHYLLWYKYKQVCSCSQSRSCHLTEEIEERREKELASSKVGLFSLFTIIKSLTSLITA